MHLPMFPASSLSPTISVLLLLFSGLFVAQEEAKRSRCKNGLPRVDSSGSQSGMRARIDNRINSTGVVFSSRCQKLQLPHHDEKARREQTPLYLLNRKNTFAMCSSYIWENRISICSYLPVGTPVQIVLIA